MRRLILLVVVVLFMAAVFGPLLLGFGIDRGRSAAAVGTNATAELNYER